MNQAPYLLPLPVPLMRAVDLLEAAVRYGVDSLPVGGKEASQAFNPGDAREIFHPLVRRNPDEFRRISGLIANGNDLAFRLHWSPL